MQNPNFSFLHKNSNSNVYIFILIDCFISGFDVVNVILLSIIVILTIYYYFVFFFKKININWPGRIIIIVFF